MRPLPSGEGGTDGDVQRRGAGDACAGGRLARRGQREAAGFEEVREQREQPQLRAVAQLLPVVGLDRRPRVLGDDDDAGVRSSTVARARRLIAALIVWAPG
jgi:hypothetical protein